MATLVGIATAAVFATWAVLVVVFGRFLKAIWQEPVFRVPILIFESDDWGPAPEEHATILSSIADVLHQFRDAQHHAPVMTLGVILAVPETRNSASQALEEVTLMEPRFAPILASMRAGLSDGVFQLHLHGRSHYWPDALWRARQEDPAVMAWLGGTASWRTEDLPSGLQSRYGPEINGAPLPIADDAVRIATEGEARLFQKCFGARPLVAVPTTFVWRPAAEAGWAAGGVRVLVTPGHYYRNRDEFTRPHSVPIITNGMRSNGLVYIVRDRYFEPYKGHTAAHGLQALAQNTSLGRPTLLEIHRVNFIEDSLRRRSLSTIDELVRRAISAYPDVRFLSTLELAEAIKARAPDLIDGSLSTRLTTWCSRTRSELRFWRLARLTGLALLVRMVAAAIRRMPRRNLSLSRGT